MDVQQSFDQMAPADEPASAGRPRGPRGPYKPRTPCKACGIPVPRRPNVYCSITCQQDYYYRRYVERWLAGEVSGAEYTVLSKYIKRYLRETRGERCQECGWARVHAKTGRVPLHVHHLDGRYDHNRPENLRLLCPNCHSLTDTYGSLNNGRGRPYHVVKGGRL